MRPGQALSALLLALSLTAAVNAEEAQPRPTPCQVRKDARYTFRLDRVEVSRAAQIVADITCRTVIVDDAVAAVRLTVVTPVGSQHTADEIYALFVGALHAQGLEAQTSGLRLTIRRRS